MLVFYFASTSEFAKFVKLKTRNKIPLYGSWYNFLKFRLRNQCLSWLDTSKYWLALCPINTHLGYATEHEALTGPPTDGEGRQLQYFDRQQPAFREIFMDVRWLKTMEFYTKFRYVYY